MREIVVRSRSGAEKFLSDVPWAAIQISGRQGDWPSLSPTNRVALLQMSFPDRALPDSQYPADKLFSEAQADEILDFVLASGEHVDSLLVHCEVGTSRSPAVAAALTRIFLEGDYLCFFHQRSPNIRVYGLLFARAVKRGLCDPPDP